jgi:hypothetical protein
MIMTNGSSTTCPSSRFNIKAHDHHIQVPSDYSDLLLERYFGEEQAAKLKDVFGCSSETVIECNEQFDRFLTSYGWNCNTRSALKNLQGNSDFGPIYVTQFNTRSCDPDENGDFAKTCHCTDASFMYNQNFVVPRVEGHYSADEKKYDEWRDSDNTKSLLSSTQNTWGTFFRTGQFPSGTIVDFNNLDFPSVNVVDESSTPYKQEVTFEDECSVLDDVLGDNYLNRGWSQIGENFHYAGHEECILNDEGFLPADYRGSFSTTAGGLTCQNWSHQEPHVHDRLPEDNPGQGLGDHNYCRNPDGEHSAWCYTTDPDMRWDYCGCDTKSDSDKVSARNNGAAEECKLNEHGYLPENYSGGFSTTVSGYTCQNWDSQEPHAHDRTATNYPDGGLGNHNHCRNPDGEHSAWCYTTDPDTKWEYCVCD